MGINKKVQSELSNINVRKKVQLANDLIFYRFTTKHVRLTIMLVTGLESVIVRNLVKYIIILQGCAAQYHHFMLISASKVIVLVKA